MSGLEFEGDVSAATEAKAKLWTFEAIGPKAQVKAIGPKAQVKAVGPKAQVKAIGPKAQVKAVKFGFEAISGKLIVTDHYCCSSILLHAETVSTNGSKNKNCVYFSDHRANALHNVLVQFIGYVNNLLSVTL